MNLQDYKSAYNFLAGHFADSRSAGLTDQNVVDELINMNTDIGSSKIIKEISLLLEINPFPWKELQDATLFHYESEDAAKTWLTNVYHWLCERYEKKYGKPPIID